MSERQYIQSGFALPMLLISSVVMMLVLLAGVQSVVSLTVAINNQRYVEMAREAAESGLKYAQTCIDQGKVSWIGGAQTLYTKENSTDNCDNTTKCTSTWCYVVNSTTTNERTSYAVTATGPGGPDNNIYTINAVGTYEALKPDGSTQAFTTTSTLNVKYTLDLSSAVASSSSGNLLVCGIVKVAATTTNQVYCWGENRDGRTGVGYFNSLPTSSSNLATCNSLSITYIVDDNISCDPPIRGLVIRKETGALYNTSGVDISATRSRQMLDHDVGVAAGGGFACAISEGKSGFTTRKVFCWGSNNKDRLGAGDTLRASGSANCKTITGSDQDGEGADTYVACSTPVQVKSAPWTADGYYPYDITAGTSFACVLAKATNSAGAPGGVYCWGARSAEGKLGDGTTGGSSDTPVRVLGVNSGFLGAKAIGGSIGAATCAIDNSDRTVCWGSNDFNQLGQGINDTTSRSRPVFVQVQASTDIMTASKVVIHGGAQSGGAESAHACAIGKQDATYGPGIVTGKIYCWGNNDYGQLGLDGAPGGGTGKAKLVPRLFTNTDGASSDLGTTNYTAQDLAIANKASCVIATIGASTTKNIYCWGNNNLGLLGAGASNTTLTLPSPCSAGPTAAHSIQCDANSDGSDDPVRTRPVPISMEYLEGNQPSKIVGGAIRFCTIAGSSNYCWGRNQVGQIGNGKINTFRAIPTLSTFLEIAGSRVYF